MLFIIEKEQIICETFQPFKYSKFQLLPHKSHVPCFCLKCELQSDFVTLLMFITKQKAKQPTNEKAFNIVSNYKFPECKLYIAIYVGR